MKNITLHSRKVQAPWIRDIATRDLNCEGINLLNMFGDSLGQVVSHSSGKSPNFPFPEEENLASRDVSYYW